MSQTVLITGATAGIGEATAHLLAQHRYRLILTGRRQERLTALADKLETETHLLNFDVRQPEAVKEAINGLPTEWNDIDILINNAGLAVGAGPIQAGLLEDWDRMIDTNVKGLLHVSRAVLPGMVARETGHIVNVASIAGKEVYPGGNVYCATKHAVDALSQAIRIDTLPYGIKVSNIAPGAVETEFSMVRYKGDKEKADKVYQGYEALRAEDIADVIHFAISRPAHVSIHDLVIMPKAQATARMLHRHEN